MRPRTYEHAGRRVRAMRLVGNGPDVADWLGSCAVAFGEGLSGELMLVDDADDATYVKTGDWVCRWPNGGWTIVDQAEFAARFVEVRHADKQ